MKLDYEVKWRRGGNSTHSSKGTLTEEDIQKAICEKEGKKIVFGPPAVFTEVNITEAKS